LSAHFESIIRISGNLAINFIELLRHYVLEIFKLFQISPTKIFTVGLSCETGKIVCNYYQCSPRSTFVLSFWLDISTSCHLFSAFFCLCHCVYVRMSVSMFGPNHKSTEGDIRSNINIPGKSEHRLETKADPVFGVRP